MTDEFKPQFPPALLRASYKRWSNSYGKFYVGAFYRGNSPVKFTTRIFKRASEAEEHCRKMLARYARLVTAKMLSLVEVPA
jgi:hypothetical protein